MNESEKRQKAIELAWHISESTPKRRKKSKKKSSGQTIGGSIGGGT